MAKLSSNYIAALDIGSTKVVCLIAEVTADNNINILGIGHQISRGIKSSVITDIKAAEESIRTAVGAAENMAGIQVDRVIVNISGSKQKSTEIKVETPITGTGISLKDIQKLITEGSKQAKTESNELVHSIPLDFAIDGTKGIKDPTDMFGHILGVTINVISADSTFLYNLSNCLAKCHLDIEEYIVSSYASSIACLNDDEKELGVTLLDFGGGNTSISIWKNGNMIYSSSVPLGGVHITNDIAIGLSTNIESAERIKNLYGNVLHTSKDEQEIIDVPFIGENGRTETNHIPRSHLVDIIAPRAEEILEKVKDNLDKAGYKNTGGNVVITGGTSQLSGLKEYVNRTFKKQVRQGIPRNLDGLAESTKGPAFSTCIGMVLYSLEREYNDPFFLTNQNKHSGNIFGKLTGWFKNNF